MPFSARDISQMKAAHKGARDHYRGKIKSCNKIYKNAGEDKRKQTRNENAIIFFESWNELDRQFDVAFQKQFSKEPEEMSPYYSGMQRVSGDRSPNYDIDMDNAVVANGGFTQGNCLDMSETVVYYCVRRGIPLQNVWIGSAFAEELSGVDGDYTPSTTVDHAFVAVAENKHVISAAGSIGTMFSLPSDAMWILDCWMNVVCDAKDYGMRIRQQLNKWSTDGKIVLLEPEDLAQRFQAEYGRLEPNWPQDQLGECERLALQIAIEALELDKFDHGNYANRLASAQLTWRNAK